MHHICCKMDDGASHLHVSIKADLSRTRQVELYIQHQISLNAMLSSKIPLSDAKVNHLQNKPLRSAQTLALAGRRGSQSLLFSCICQKACSEKNQQKKQHHSSYNYPLPLKPGSGMYLLSDTNACWQSHIHTQKGQTHKTSPSSAYLRR